jgi:hypothetical protein
MRLGSNPNKDVLQGKSQFFHQVIIPVYIPNEEGYFLDGFTIFKYNLESLFNTIHDKTYISIVNNGSCEKIKEYLDELLKANLINELIHTDNIGKVNAVLKGLVGHSFPIVTISDSDVMFLNNWQKESYAVFNAFPKVGVVGLTPMLNLGYYLTSNIFFKNIFSSKIKFSKIINPNAMRNFYKSIGREEEFDTIDDKRTYILKRNGIDTIIGSGHYVASYRGDIFNVVKKFSNFKLGGDIEFQIDELAFKKGYWRMTTLNNFAYHLGNTAEEWMKEEIEKLKKPNNLSCVEFKQWRKPSKIEYFIVNKLFQKILYSKLFRRFLEKTKIE